MLVTACHFGQWVEITHRSGDMLRIRVMAPRPDEAADLRLVFQDDPRHFEVERPGRNRPAHAAATSARLVPVDD